MASELGISQGEYSKLENGKKNNYQKFLPDIARILGERYEDLVDAPKYHQHRSSFLRMSGMGKQQQVQWLELLLQVYQDKDHAKELLIKKLLQEIEGLKLENKFLRKNQER